MMLHTDNDKLAAFSCSLSLQARHAVCTNSIPSKITKNLHNLSTCP